MTSLALVLVLAAAARGAVINSIEPAEGSLAGGTLVTIAGSGFNRDGVEGDTRVFIGVDECAQIAYYSTDIQLICRSPPNTDGDEELPVVITLVSFAAAEFAACADADCTFDYRTDRTPVVRSLSRALSAGEILEFAGDLYGRYETDYEARVNGLQCALDMIDDLNDDTIVPWGSYGSALCPMPEQAGGRYNFTLHVDDASRGYGNAQYDGVYRVVDFPAREPFMIAQLARVDGISHAAVGALGGNLVTITGAGFGTEPSVLLAGVPCAVIAASESEITCRPGVASASAAAAAGGLSGLLYKRFENRDSSFDWETTLPDVKTVHTDGPEGPDNGSRDLYSQEFSGMFVAPVAANYSFYLASDDDSALYIGDDQTTAVASIPQWTSSGDYYRFDTQISAPIYLDAGERTAFLLRHSDGYGSDHVRAAVRVHSPAGASPLHQTHHLLRERQTVDLHVDVVREQQTITLRNVTGGEIRLALSSPTGSDSDDALTDEIDIAADDAASRMDSLLPDILGSLCNSFSVSRSSIDDHPDGGFEFVVTLHCPTTSAFPLLSVVNTGLDAGQNLDISVARTRDANEPAGGVFRLNVLGTWTDYLDFDASNDELRSAVEAVDGVNTVSVSRSGRDLDGYTWAFVFEDYVGDVPTFMADTDQLTGDSVGIDVIAVEDGSDTDVFFDPIPPEFFQLPASGVEITTGDVRATCASFDLDGCTFEYDADLTPRVTAVSPASVTRGTTITVVGSGFASTNAADLVLAVGPAPCADVAIVDASTVTCVVGDGPAGVYALSFLDALVGEALLVESVSDITYELRVDSVTPLAGSLFGGTVVTVSGAGLDAPAQHTLEIGGAICEPFEMSPAQILCLTPPADGASVAMVLADATSPVAIALVDASAGGALYTDASQFVYDAALTPVVDGMTPETASTAATVEATLSGSLFAANTTVTVGPRACEPTSIADDAIVCRLVRLAESPAAVDVSAPVVWVPAYGYAAIVSGVEMAQGFQIDSIAPDMGSFGGHTSITIAGRYFPTNTDLSVVLKINGSLVSPDGTNVDGDDHGHGHDHGSEHGDDDDGEHDGDGHMGRRRRVSDYTSHEADRVGVMRRLIRSLQDQPLVRGPAARQARQARLAQRRSMDHGHHGEPEENHHVHDDALTSDEIIESGIPCTISAATDEMIVCTTGAALGFFDADIVTDVELTANAILAANPGGAAFTYSNLTTPTLDQVAPAAASGDFVLTIAGSLFDAGAATPTVTIAGLDCPVLQVMAEYVLCQTPMFSAGPAHVSVHVPGLGRAVGGVEFERLLNVSSIDPVEGSAAGGRPVTFVGDGFGLHAAQNSVTFGGVLGAILHSSYRHLVVLPPPAADPLAASAQTADIVLEIVRSSVASDPTTYTYSPALTPIVSGVSPLAAFKGDAIVVTGTGFGTDASTVAFGGEFCAVSTWTSTQIECVLGGTPAGVHAPRVTVPGAGYAAIAATGSTTIESLSELASITPAMGSFAGGDAVTITGRGLGGDGDGQWSGSTVQLCNSECTVINSTYDRVVCVTGAVRSLESLALYPDAYEPEPLEALATTTVIDGEGETAFDESVETRYRASAGTGCTVGIDLGPDTVGHLTRIRFYPVYRNTRAMRNGRFEGSADGVSWTELAQIEGIPQEGWNFIDMDMAADTAYRFLRYRGPSGSHCLLNEIDWFGYALSAQASADADTVCSPVVSAVSGDYFVETQSTPVANATVEFDADETETPQVVSIKPDFGSSLGGTLVTLSGSGFTAASAEIVLNGVPCAVNFVSHTLLTCISGARDAIRPVSVAATRGSQEGSAVVSLGVGFRYLDRWSELNTWLNDEPPVAGDSVIVPDGQTVLMDVSPPRLFLLLVQGEMVFDRQDLELDAFYIFIKGGTFEIGTEEKPFLNQATITLHGDRIENIEIPHVGNKVLAVSDDDIASHHTHGSGGLVSQADKGFLDIHGRPRLRVWTKLAETAAAGSDIIVTAEDVDFEAGDQLVVTGASRGLGGMAEVEVAELVDARTVRLTAPLANTHESEIRVFDGVEVDMRVEVGLLSRNVLVRGDRNSEAQLYGGHVIAVHGGTLRVENAEFMHGGQAFNLGRYQLHTHVAGVQTESYIRSNSIHHSFQRATTIHGTHRLRVQHNFAYHVMGHQIFVEDGDETHNVIEGNLAAMTLKSFALLKSDTKPSAFWMSSPKNIWRHNVATGSVNDGYWFELPGRPGGAGASTDNVCPVHGHLIEFFNNTAHHNGVKGLRIYPQWTPLADPCNGGSPKPQYLYDFTSHHNSQGIFTKVSGDLHHVNSRLVENGDAEVFWTKLESVEYRDDPHIKDALVVGRIDADQTPSYGSKTGIFAPQNEFFYVSGAKFVNYGDAGAIKACAKCDSQTDLKQGGFTFRFDGLEFVNTQRRVFWTAPFKQILWDLDGTLTGHVNGTALPYYAFNHHAPACDEGGAVYDDGMVCDGSVRVRRLQLDGVNPRELDFKVLNVTSAAGTDLISFRPKEFYGWAVPIVGAHWYTVDFHESYIDFQSADLRYSEPEYVRQDGLEWLGLEFPFIDTRYQFEVTYAGDGRLRPWLESRLPTPSDPLGTGYTNYNASTWSVMINTVNTTRDESGDPYAMSIFPLQCFPGQCDAPDDTPLGDRMPWSDPESWESGEVPGEGEDVVIPSGVHILMDVSPPMLGKVTIEGKLEFDDTADRTLNALNIVVWGELEIGTAMDPFEHTARIQLHDRRFQPTVVVDNNLFLGNNMMVVLGTLTLHGAQRTMLWTRLATTAEAGSDTLTLAEAAEPHWRAGDELVLTSTEINADEVERVTVASVSGSTVTLTAPLAHSHFGGVIQTGEDGSTVALSAGVGLLTRSVVISGDDEATVEGDGYGVHIVVAEVVDDDRIGQAVFNFTQLERCGKLESEHPSVLFKYFRDHEAGRAPVNVVANSAFASSLNYAIVGERARNLRIVNNVIHRTFRTSVDLDEDSTGAVIRNNLVAGSMRSPDETSDWVRPFAAFYLNVAPGELSGNLAGGSQDGGFVFPPEACGESRIWGNEAHGALIGVWLLSQGGDCVQLREMTVWKSAHVGIFSIDVTASTVVLDTVVVSDNHEGISINYITGDRTGRTEIVDSVVMGSTAASAAACTSGAYPMCRAQTFSDPTGVEDVCGSVFGDGYRRVGIVASQYLNRAKTCALDGGLEVCRPPTTPERLCGLPWEKRYGLPSTQYSELHVVDTRFAHWASDDCGATTLAVSLNPSQPDYTPAMFFSGTEWFEADREARMWLSRMDVHAGECSAASGCDALLQTMVTDLDGSLTGTAGATLLSAENPTLSTEICDEMPQWGANICSGNTYAGFSLENVSGDRGSRLIGPIIFNKGDNRTYWSEGPFDDGCAKRFFFGQYPGAVLTGHEYELYTTGTAPKNTRLHFFSDDEDEAIRIRLFYSQPMQVNVFVDGEMVPEQENSEFPTLESANGANLMAPQERVLYVTLRGGSKFAIYDLVTSNVVAVTLELDVSLEDFFGEELVTNLALLLEIPPETVKVVEVHPGSVVATVHISDPEGGAATLNATENAAQVERLVEVADKLVEHIVNGTIDVGYPILEVSVEAPTADGAESTDVPSFSLAAVATPSLGPGGGSGGDDDIIVIAAAAAAGGVVVLAVVMVVMVRRRRRSVGTVVEDDDESVKMIKLQNRSASPPPVASLAATKEKNMSAAEIKASRVAQNKTQETKVDMPLGYVGDDTPRRSPTPDLPPVGPRKVVNPEDNVFGAAPKRPSLPNVSGRTSTSPEPQQRGPAQLLQVETGSDDGGSARSVVIDDQQVY